MFKSKVEALFVISLTSMSSSATPLPLNTACSNKAISAPKKNVIMIAVDDLKPLLNCYDNNIAKTPNIDYLASKGTLFNAAYCQQAVSGASRSSLLTGWYPDRTRVWDLKTLIRDENPDVVTLPQYFKNNGYTTAGIGKIFDPRSVDKQNDSRSWSVPYIDHFDYLNPGFQKPIMGQYQSESTREAYDMYYNEAVENGLSDKKEIEAYIQSKIKPSSECVVLPDDAYTDGGIANGAIEFINNYKSDTPYFFAIGFKKPHLPFCAPKQYWDLYSRDEMPLASYRERAINSPSIAYHNNSEIQNYTDIPAISSFSDFDSYHFTDDKARELIHGYYACMSYTDAQIGKVLQALEQSGQADNTIIVLWGDHGWHLGDHGLWAKHTNFENATRVPFIIVDPSCEGHRQVNNPVELLSIYPTLCDLAGLNTPQELDGANLSQLLKGEVATIKPYAVSQYPRSGKMGYSIRDSRYRYTVWVDWENRELNTEVIAAEELYDYEVDWDETTNVASKLEYQGVLKQMRSYWEEYKNDILNPSPAGEQIIHETFNTSPWKNSNATTSIAEYNTVDGIWKVYNTEINIDEIATEGVSKGALLLPQNGITANVGKCPFVEIPLIANKGVTSVEIVAKYASKTNVYSQLELQKWVNKVWVTIGKTSINETNFDKPTKYTFNIDDVSDNIALRIFYDGKSESSAIGVYDVMVYGANSSVVNNLCAKNITDHGFDLLWDEVASADQYQVVISTKEKMENVELVKNGDAEWVDDDSWKLNNAAIVADKVYAGSGAFKMVAGNSNASMVQQVAVIPNTAIKITAKAFIDENITGTGTPTTYTSEMRLWGQFLNDRSESIGNVRIAGLKELKEPSTDWFTMELPNVLVPHDAVFLSLDFRAQVGVKAYLDNLSVIGTRIENTDISENPILTSQNYYSVAGLAPNQAYSVFVHATVGDKILKSHELIVNTSHSTGLEVDTQKEIVVYLVDNVLYLDNVKPGAMIYIFNALGQTVYYSTINDTSFKKELGKGFYLVKIGETIYKVLDL